MKKIIVILMMVLCGFALVGGGILLSTNYSQAKVDGGEVTDPGEGEEGENPGDGEGGDVSPDANTEFSWTVKGIYRTSSTSYSTAYSSENDTNNADSKVRFSVYWRDENGNTATLKSAIGYTLNAYPTTGYTVGGGSDSSTNLKYVYYGFWNIFTYKRYIYVSASNVGTSYCFGVSTSASNNSSNRSRDTTGYIYNGAVTNSSSTAKSNCSQKLSGTYYVIYRQGYTVTYNKNGGSGGTSSQTIYAGIGYTLTSNTPSRSGYTFAGWNTNSSGTGVTYSAGYTLGDSSANGSKTYYAKWTPKTYTVTYNRNYSTTTTSTQSVTYNSSFTTKSRTTFTRTGYTITNWSTSTSSVTGSYTGVGSSYTYKTVGNTTLYAQWTINTYTLTIRYYGGSTRQSNTTNLNITASNCTVSSSSIASGSSATVKHTYTTGSYGVVLKLSNSASYDYYLRTGSEPTTSSYTKLYTTSSDSYTYTWKPDSNDTLNIYVKQRYSISYNVNGGSGTLPSTTYKIHGTSATLGANNLTKTSYTAYGWNTNTTGTGTHYNSSGSYSVNASDTLYADWTAKTSTIKVQIKTSTNGSSYSNSVTGGTVSVRYYYDSNNSPVQSSSVSVTSASATTIATNALISRAVTFTPTAKSGYVYVGISTSTSAPNSTVTTFTPSSSGATYTINVFFKVLSDNQLKYDSTEKYWYFEHGEYPQSYVGTTMNNTLNNASPSKSSEIRYNDGTTNKIIEVYTYNSKRYARLQATSTQTLKMSDGTSYTFTSGQYYWFEVEPIRWRVSDYGVSSTSYPSGWSTYGTYKTNFTVVSDRILTLGAVETEKVSEGWAFTNSDTYSNVSGLNKAESTTNFSAGITNKQAATGYTYYRFGDAGQQDKVVSVSVTEDGVRVASIDEIDDYLTDYSAKASDMVCFLLGCGTDDKVNYWTRNLGTGLGNGQVITDAGATKSNWLGHVQGVRLALTMGNGSRI